MISPSPSTVLVINIIVGLMSVGLLLSAAATREVRQGLASWVFGMLNLPDELSQDAWIHQADTRLYRAKQQRNCVVASDEALAA